MDLGGPAGQQWTGRMTVDQEDEGRPGRWLWMTDGGFYCCIPVLNTREVMELHHQKTQSDSSPCLEDMVMKVLGGVGGAAADLGAVVQQ